MGLDISGIDTLEVMLENVADRTSKRALAEMTEGAFAIADLAKEYAPVDTGSLEDAIEVEEDRGGRNRRKRLFVVVNTKKAVRGRPGYKVGQYAEFMHEGSYRLGPKSRAKQQQSGKRVGRKFLERAADELEDSIAKKVARAIRGS